jgi:hypothetical protein
MFCPNCKCEYIRGVTQCADCGVPLVDALESPEHPGNDVRIVQIWQGNDPAEFESVKEALKNGDIPFTVPDSKGLFSSLLPTEATLEIWISEADREKAKKILLDLEGRVDPGELTPEEIESLALPESDVPDSDEQTNREPDLSDDWDEEDPVAEVWNGDKEEFADTLAACLREIGIASHKLSESGHWRLVVRPEQETRAREVVREVVEASPPE